jgi:hypothetical protein
MCAKDLPSPARAEMEAKLASYTWCDSDHGLVFEALQRLRGVGTTTSSQLRHELPAQTTRMGFPDLDWEIYLGQNTTEQRDIRNLVDELLAMGNPVCGEGAVENQ